jgi:hypothetical protein
MSTRAMLASERDPSNTFKDIRSASQPKRRTKTRGKKYYNFEVVKPGQLSLPHYQASETSFGWKLFPADVAQCAVVKLNKRQLYKEAQDTAPNYMRYTGCSCCIDYLRTSNAKNKAAIKAEAFDWNKRGSRREFAGLYSHDYLWYDQLAWDDTVCQWEAEQYLEDFWFTDNQKEICKSYCWQDENDEVEDIDVLEVVVNNVIAGPVMPVKEPGWEDLTVESWCSPELDWVKDGIELFEDEEDFELV